MASKTSKATASICSMTGFASLSGVHDGQDWTWDIKGVNGRGLELRIRVPDRITGLEAEVRKRAAAALARGNVAINLRISAASDAPRSAIDPAALASAIATLKQIEAAAIEAGLDLRPTTADDIAGMKGVLDSGAGEKDMAGLSSEVLRAFDDVLKDFAASRDTEGAALQTILATQLNQVAGLNADARRAAEKRPDLQKDAMKRALSRVMDETNSVDEARLAQELAILAIKSDVTEEFDRLDTHVAAARALLKQGGPVGRKLDFLMQEFNREANTLCSKAQSSDLTAIGLDLKAVIDQMREQVQNIE